MKPQVEALDDGVVVLGKIAKKHTQSAYDALGMLLQLEQKCLQKHLSGVGALIGHIEEALREKFFPALFRGEEVDADFQKILGHSVKRGSLIILEPQ